MTSRRTTHTGRAAGLALAATAALLLATAAAGLFATAASGLSAAPAPKAPDENADGLGYTSTPLIPGQEWRVHDRNRPHPPIVAPPEPAADKPAPAPAGAVILFDGTDLSKWQTTVTKGPDKGKMVPAGWKIENGYMEVVAKSGTLITKEKFGDCRLHIEWCAPPPKGIGQQRGNSGVFFCDGRYEVQVLDSYDNKTYADGQAAAIYGQSPPRVNVCRPPGQWQTYDITFTAPRFEGDKLVKPAVISVVHNGVLVQDKWEILGTTFHKKAPAYSPHPSEGSIQLQDHGNPMRFRNIWLVPLGEAK